MKAIKNLTLVFFLLFASANIGFAQTANVTDAQKAEMKKNLEEYASALNLTDEQTPKFTEITKRYGKQLLEVANSDAGKMSKYKKVKSIRSEKNDEMKKILSGDQYDIFLKKQEEIQAKMKEKRKK